METISLFTLSLVKNLRWNIRIKKCNTQRKSAKRIKKGAVAPGRARMKVGNLHLTPNPPEYYFIIGLLENY